MEIFLAFVAAVFAAGCFYILCNAHPEEAVKLLRAYDNFESKLFLWIFRIVIWGIVIVVSLLLGLGLFAYFADQAYRMSDADVDANLRKYVLHFAAAIMSGFTVGIVLPAFLIGWWYEKRWWE